MSSFLQASDGDIALTNGRLTLVTGSAEKAQKIKNRLGLFEGEWFRDTRIGVPYYRVVLIKNPELEIVRRLYKRVILSVPGISDVTELVLEWDTATRHLSYEFRAVDDEGNPITSEPRAPFIVSDI